MSRFSISIDNWINIWIIYYKSNKSNKTKSRILVELEYGSVLPHYGRHFKSNSTVKKFTKKICSLLHLSVLLIVYVYALNWDETKYRKKYTYILKMQTNWIVDIIRTPHSIHYHLLEHIYTSNQGWYIRHTHSHSSTIYTY